MSAIKENALSKFYGVFYIRVNGTVPWFRFASVRGLTSGLGIDPIVEVISDDRQTVFIEGKPKATINVELLENADVSLLDILFPGTRTDVAGTPVAVVDEDLNPQLATALQFSQNEQVVLANKNGDNTVVASITVSNNGVALVLDTDYSVSVNSDGYTVISRIGGNLALTGTGLEVDYTYTPNASANYSVTRISTSMPRIDVRIVQTDPNTTKEREVIATDMRLTSEVAKQYVDIASAGDLTGSTLTFEQNDGGVYNETDAINANP